MQKYNDASREEFEYTLLANIRDTVLNYEYLMEGSETLRRLRMYSEMLMMESRGVPVTEEMMIDQKEE